MPRRRLHSLSFALANTFLAVALLSCGEAAGPLANTDTSAADVPSLLSSGPKLVECPISTSESTTATLLPVGGTISLAGHSITLPLGAVLTPTELTLTVPASRYVELHITANGQEHIDFALPAIITVNYSRCNRTDIDRVPLTVYYIDGETKALIENMGGLDNKLTRTITFSTGHLSSYAVAE